MKPLWGVTTIFPSISRKAIPGISLSSLPLCIESKSSINVSSPSPITPTSIVGNFSSVSIGRAVIWAPPKIIFAEVLRKKKDNCKSLS